MEAKVNMIDWHTHILPSMDDGSKNEEESVAMLSLCCDGGVNSVVLTPHFYPHKEDPDKFLRRRSKSLDNLQAYMADIDQTREKLKPWPRFILGAEVYYFPQLSAMDREEIKALSIGNSNYLMIEFPMETWGRGLYENLERLIFSKGITPVLAHIDRYFSFIKDVRPLKELVSEGMLIQLNTEALDGIFTRRKALKWINSGLVHILASDCHNISDRPPNLDQGISRLANYIGKDKAKELVSLEPI